MHTGSVNDSVSESPDHIDSALKAFGDSPERRRRNRTRELEQLKSLGPRPPVMGPTNYGYQQSRTKSAETGQEPAFNRPAVGDWTPKYPATRRLDDRAPYAHALSGIDPDRVAESDYPWSVP